MAVADNRYGFWPARSGAVPTMVPIVASQTLAAGDVVYNNGGSCQIALADTAAVAGVVARDCASLAAGTLVPIFGWEDPDMKFIAIQDDTTALVAGNELDIIGATGAMMIDGDASSVDIVTLLREVDFDEADAAGKRWVVKFNKHQHATID